VGGLVGGGGVLAASHLSGGKTTIYQGTSPNSIVSLAHVDGQTVLSPEQIYAANLGATVGVNGNVDTNVFGYTVKNAGSQRQLQLHPHQLSRHRRRQRHQGVFLRRQEL